MQRIEYNDTIDSKHIGQSDEYYEDKYIVLSKFCQCCGVKNYIYSDSTIIGTNELQYPNVIIEGEHDISVTIPCANCLEDIVIGLTNVDDNESSRLVKILCDQIGDLTSEEYDDILEEIKENEETV